MWIPKSINYNLWLYSYVINNFILYMFREIEIEVIQTKM